VCSLSVSFSSQILYVLYYTNSTGLIHSVEAASYATTQELPAFYVIGNLGSAVAQTASRQLPTAAARGQFMWDLWWTKQQWGLFSLNTLVTSAKHSTDCYTLIIIYHHRGLIQ
jgi:hypothetical protein